MKRDATARRPDIETTRQAPGPDGAPGADTLVVLDTNVFVAAGFNPDSASARIVEAVRLGALRMVWCDATRREIERVLGRIPPLRTRGVAVPFHRDERFAGPVDPERFAAIPDPDDRPFAALASAAGATLVSADRHLLDHRGPEALTVLTPGAFWRRHRDAAGRSGGA